MNANGHGVPTGRPTPTSNPHVMSRETQAKTFSMESTGTMTREELFKILMRRKECLLSLGVSSSDESDSSEELDMLVALENSDSYLDLEYVSEGIPDDLATKMEVWMAVGQRCGTVIREEHSEEVETVQEGSSEDLKRAVNLYFSYWRLWQRWQDTDYSYGTSPVRPVDEGGQ